jgi:hypothetical protein
MVSIWLISVSFEKVDDERMNALFQMEAKLNPCK